LLSPERQSALLAYDRGMALCQQGKVGPGMLWLVNPPLEATSGDALQFKLGFERALAKQNAEHVNGL